mmetsp:Transcript_69999/g.130871  ORF Transcript_69999/g.130871 Transcript_69999/m.130871 type:complete len:206 (+) Transcript_69999:817-1434(+)
MTAGNLDVSSSAFTTLCRNASNWTVLAHESRPAETLSKETACCDSFVSASVALASTRDSLSPACCVWDFTLLHTCSMELVTFLCACHSSRTIACRCSLELFRSTSSCSTWFDKSLNLASVEVLYSAWASWISWNLASMCKNIRSLVAFCPRRKSSRSSVCNFCCEASRSSKLVTFCVMTPIAVSSRPCILASRVLANSICRTSSW